MIVTDEGHRKRIRIEGIGVVAVALSGVRTEACQSGESGGIVGPRGEHVLILLPRRGEVAAVFVKPAQQELRAIEQGNIRRLVPSCRGVDLEPLVALHVALQQSKGIRSQRRHDVAQKALGFTALVQIEERSCQGILNHREIEPVADARRLLHLSRGNGHGVA